MLYFCFESRHAKEVIKICISETRQQSDSMARQFWLEVILLVVVSLVLGSRGSRKGNYHFV